MKHVIDAQWVNHSHPREVGSRSEANIASRFRKGRTKPGHDLGVAWCPPWTVKIPAGSLMGKDNCLEIEVVNFWPNRLIGDAQSPRDQRRTKTDITKFDNPNGDPHYTTLRPSGLLGPVTISMTKD
jgi:hypothetical protein